MIIFALEGLKLSVCWTRNEYIFTVIFGGMNPTCFTQPLYELV